ncbi:hypothetical protein V8E36_004869 [Tilletia maclaganii]
MPECTFLDALTCSHLSLCPFPCSSTFHPIQLLLQDHSLLCLSRKVFWSPEPLQVQRSRRPGFMAVYDPCIVTLMRMSVGTGSFEETRNADDMRAHSSLALYARNFVSRRFVTTIGLRRRRSCPGSSHLPGASARIDSVDHASTPDEDRHSWSTDPGLSAQGISTAHDPHTDATPQACEDMNASQMAVSRIQPTSEGHSKRAELLAISKPVQPGLKM